MPPLWQKLEDMPVWEAVAADWRRHIGSDFDALTRQQIIAPCGNFSAGHPCTRKPPCGCWHRQKPGTLTMVCDCAESDCADFTVTQEDLRLHKLDTARLADAIRALLSVKRPVRKLPEYEGVFSLGTYSPVPHASYPVYLIIPSSSEGQKEALAGLVASHDKRIAVVLFTRASVDPRQEFSLRRAVLFIFLDETMFVGAAGTLSLLPLPHDPLRQMQSTTTTPAADNDLIRVVELAEKLSERRPKNGPTALQFLAAYARGMTHEKIALKYKCSRSQVTSLKGQIEKQLGVDLQNIVQRSGDLADTVKKVEDRHAKKIYQRTAVTGREEEDE